MNEAGRQDALMPISESLTRALVAEAKRNGEAERERFQASRGTYYGLNGTYSYVVTDHSLWQARSTVLQLFGGAPSIKHWPLNDCAVTRDGNRVVLSTPDGEHRVAFLTEALADEAVAAMRPPG